MVEISIVIFCRILRCHLFFSYIPEKRFCPWRHSLGRCFCISNCFYRYVADDQKESGKLALVDRYQYSINTIILCKTLCVYQCVLFWVVNNGCMGVAGMDKKGKTISCLKKLSS